MEENFINQVIDLYKANKWKEIVNKYHDYPERNKLLWVFPSEDNFEYIESSLKGLGCVSVLSVGCGSGLLEWMITAATGYPVKGIEIDGAWWQCKYAPPTFIPLSFTTPELDKDTISTLQNCKKTALLFCYFNNRDAFVNYLNRFSGNVLIIIGPGDGKGVHTDPRPFGDINDGWVLYSSQEVRSSMDFIAIYRRLNIV